MGNRLLEEKCIVCGEDLKLPFNSLRACSECTPKLMKVIYETRMQDRKKRGKAIVRANLSLSRDWIGDKPEGGF